MLTPEQKAEAEKKLKNISEELAQEEELKSKIKKSIKTINDAISNSKGDPKKQMELLRNLANQDLPSKIFSLDHTNTALVDTQQKMKTQREKLNRQALQLIQDKGRLEGGIDQIKKTIVNIQKTVKESVEEEVKKRNKIGDDLQKSLDDIRNKIKEFQEESEKFTQENTELQGKIEALKSKLSGIEDTYKVKAQEKDEETKGEREELNDKLKTLEAEVEKATELSKEYSGLQKQNFDNKIALYLKIKKFPQYFSSFQSSANSLNSCKQELQKGVQRMNTASETIQSCNKTAEQTNNQFLVQLRRQKEKQNKIEEVKKEKEAVRANIIDLQNKIKEKKAKA